MAQDNVQNVLYGTEWCPGTWFACCLFDEHQVPYCWVDIDRDPAAAAQVEEINNGYRSAPTIVFPDGSIMMEPSGMALRTKLQSLK